MGIRSKAPEIISLVWRPKLNFYTPKTCTKHSSFSSQSHCMFLKSILHKRILLEWITVLAKSCLWKFHQSNLLHIKDFAEYTIKLFLVPCLAQPSFCKENFSRKKFAQRHDYLGVKISDIIIPPSFTGKEDFCLKKGVYYERYW